MTMNRASSLAAALLLSLLALALPWPTGQQAAAREDRHGGRGAVEADFLAWVDALWPRAKAAGVSQKTFRSAFAGVKLAWNLPDLRPPGMDADVQTSKQQPEFSSPGRYFNQTSLDNLVTAGRVLLDRWKDDLDAIERRYKVPRGIVMSIWGRETSYGRAALPHDAIQVLATQAFMGRRKAQFQDELIMALRILQDGHIRRAAMKSSWAGAMGLPQFLPSDFNTHAVDHDGDGARDIWTTIPDVLASIANSLRHKGWRDTMSWGYEVEIPASMACTLEGPHQGRPFSDWVARGVKRTRGRGFADAVLRETGYLLLPAGRYGPAFIVTDNFYVLKQYNESDVYALFVGHVADRYGNNRPFAGRWSGVETFRRDHVRTMQEQLAGIGLDVGGADGLIGFKTRVATGLYEQSHGLAEKCYPTPELMQHIARTLSDQVKSPDR